jgi:tetratricopeptide (TPR) repeat protein
MLLNWFDAREATRVGVALADDFVVQKAGASRAAAQKSPGKPSGHLQRQLQKFLQRVDREVRPMELNPFKRAKLANSFKWRLLEEGVEPQVVDELTQTLLLRLTAGPIAPPRAAPPDPKAATKQRASASPQTLLSRGDDFLARDAYPEAAECYQELLQLEPRHAVACNSLGAALGKLGRLREAEAQFRRAIGIRASYPEALCNLGMLLRSSGRLLEAEMPLRRALKLKPTHLDSQIALGTTLFLLGRLSEARSLLERALKLAPRNVDALLALGSVTAREGRFADGEAMFRRALEIDPNAPGGWAGLAGLRRMTADDDDWLKGAETCLASELEPLPESSLRYAIGKYYDDIGDFRKAFLSYHRANELQRTVAKPYDREARTRFVDDLMRVYTRERLSSEQGGASDSVLPVFVVGMPRSGTSLVEQILASHPGVRAAGELEFWTLAMRKHEAALREQPPGEALVRELVDGYRRTLAAHAGPAARVIDKSPFNSEYLGVIQLIFPKARAIYLQRHPVDTCLSCYFQELPAELNFALDLADLAHYYREHRRLIEHWRNTLSPGSLLVVPYEGLVADQEKWTRRMLDFLGLPWDDRCLDFHLTESTVLTVSFWQVRQALYQSSVGRWRNYKEFIRPLLSLSETPQ